MTRRLIMGFASALLFLTNPISASAGSPEDFAGKYVKHRGGDGDMLLRQERGQWAVYVDAGGIPNGAATAADCALIAFGQFKGDVFEGEIKLVGDATDPKWTERHYDKEDMVEPGHKMTVKFTGKKADVNAESFGICGNNDGTSGLYTKAK
jgi:hypothetical protein